MDRFQDVNNGRDGFTIIECIIALILTTVGVLAVFSLMDVGMRLQLESRDATTANGLARAKVEQLQNSSPSSSERCQGGDSTFSSNVTGYNDLPDPRFRRRWHITNSGVPANTQRVTVRVVGENLSVRIPIVEIMTLMPTGTPVCL